MSEKKKSCDCEKGSPKWMTTFTDMNMLLLTFFVLLVSMSTLDKKKILESLGSFQGSSGLLSGSRNEVSAQNIMTRINVIDQTGSSNAQTAETLRDYVKSANLSDVVSVIETKKGVSIRVLDSLLFAPGSADVQGEAIPFLRKVGTVIVDSPYYTHVEGHTDDTPSRSARFPSNWELSTARSVSVVRFLITEGVNPQSLSAGGFGEFHPLLPNITDENRARNRRVEINLVSPEFAETNKNIFEEDNGGQ
ncbi:flagellar motor protein MotB [Geovibrio thiophilus]|uniref:Flagellar motor protein MotB n=1 Tax=Geovibrio thiophilus TaxID=139438 RepID=A0A410JW15_9BACT|nr:flagellar motor protein MotB [Geovibrio thiophilus]QAR32386.1 flagellar motor protein MotB [Geovibrio thiophilus]